MKAKHRHLCVCRRTCFLRASPATCLKLLSANIPILPSLHHFPSFPLSSHFVHFPLTALSCLYVVFAGTPPQLHSTNQFPPESVTPGFFFFFMLSPPISSSPPFSSSTSIWCASFSHFAQLCSSEAYLLRLIHHYFLSMSTSSTFSLVISLSFPPKVSVIWRFVPSQTSHSLPVPVPLLCFSLHWLELMGTGGRPRWSILN